MKRPGDFLNRPGHVGLRLQAAPRLSYVITSLRHYVIITLPNHSTQACHPARTRPLYGGELRKNVQITLFTLRKYLLCFKCTFTRFLQNTCRADEPLQEDRPGLRHYVITSLLPCPITPPKPVILQGPVRSTEGALGNVQITSRPLYGRSFGKTRNDAMTQLSRGAT